MREHGVWRGDNIHLTRDGRELHVASSITVVRDRSGAPAGQIRVLRDVTERRRAEEQIRCLNHALESRVIERTAALRAAVDSLESEIAERQRLEREILEISEHEKARVGQDLHDGLCQTLTGIALIAKVLQRNLEDEKLSLAAASADTKTIVSLVKDAISEARNLATEMYPVNIEEYGLAPALEKLTASMANRFRNTCRFKCPEPVELADNQVAAHLYRITQEAVSNASNHGDASMVVVTFAAAGDRVTLTIEDNGNGRLKNLKSTGMGLKTMDYRARAIGGSLEIKQRPRFGLAIICTFPNRQRKDV